MQSSSIPLANIRDFCSDYLHLRDALRSGDVWLTRSRRYGYIRRALLPASSLPDAGRTAVPAGPDEWLANRRTGHERTVCILSLSRLFHGPR